MSRDDHAMSECSDSSFFVFGGFVNGSRTNELAKFSMANSQTYQSALLQENNTEDETRPKPRASHASACWNDKLYVFGGQDDDNNKLEDLWEFDANSGWRQIQIEEGAFVPTPRSGHSAVTYGNKMYIFGGIFELTKELNDMLVFDFTQGKFVQGEERPDYIEGGSPERRAGTMQ